jgi:hypothetical protein
MKDIGRLLLWLLVAAAAVFGFKWLMSAKAAAYRQELLDLRAHLDRIKAAEMTEIDRQKILERIHDRMEAIREETKYMRPADRVRELLDLIPPDDGPGIWG